MAGTFFRVSFICLLCLLTGLRLYYKLRAGFLKERLYSREEHVAFIVYRSVLGVPLLWAVFSYAFAPGRFDWMYVPLPFWLRVAGVVLGGGALALLFWVHQSLGESFSTSLAPRRNHAMVTSGPYAWVRHPMYSAYFALFLAVFLISRNWLAGSTGLAIILMLMTFRRVREESYLVERFAERYQSYRQSTGTFVPRLSRLTRPEPRQPVSTQPVAAPREPTASCLQSPTASAKRHWHEQQVGSEGGPAQHQAGPRRQP